MNASFAREAAKSLKTEKDLNDFRARVPAISAGRKRVFRPHKIK